MKFNIFKIRWDLLLTLSYIFGTIIIVLSLILKEYHPLLFLIYLIAPLWGFYTCIEKTKTNLKPKKMNTHFSNSEQELTIAEQLDYDIEHIFNKKFPENKLIKEMPMLYSFPALTVHYLSQPQIITLLSIANGRICLLQIDTNRDGLIISFKPPF